MGLLHSADGGARRRAGPTLRDGLTGNDPGAPVRVTAAPRRRAGLTPRFRGLRPATRSVPAGPDRSPRLPPPARPAADTRRRPHGRAPAPRSARARSPAAHRSAWADTRSQAGVRTCLHGPPWPPGPQFRRRWKAAVARSLTHGRAGWADRPPRARTAG